jgi:integrase
MLTDFVSGMCAGRAGDELIYLGASRADPWLRLASGSKIIPPVGYRQLPHTLASLPVSVPLLVVAKNLGHSDTRMVEKHYGHLAPSYVADAIRAGAPRFGFKPDRKLAVLGR